MWPIYLQQHNYFQKIVVIIYDDIDPMENASDWLFASPSLNYYFPAVPHYFSVVCLPSSEQNTVQTRAVQPHNLHSKLAF